LPREILIAAAIVGALLLLLVAVVIINFPPDVPTFPTSHPSTTPHLSTTATTRPSGSTLATARPTTAGTAQPTSAGSVPPTTIPSAGTPEAALLVHVPDAIRPTCTTTPGVDDVLASADCTSVDGALTVTYVQYASAAPMNQAYGDAVGRSQIEPNTGSCEEHDTWPAESSYDVDGELAGRRLCTDNPGSPTIVWTYDSLAIISQAASQGGDAAGLVEFWTTEAGPVP
jgi:hypothetical protein